MPNSLWGVATWDSFMWNETDTAAVPIPLPGTTDLTYMTFHVSISPGPPLGDSVHLVISN